jgi:hypothetical protein
MPAKVLLVSLGLRENGQIEGDRGIVFDNVRWSSYFIQMFQDDWGPRDLFRNLFLLALECRGFGVRGCCLPRPLAYPRCTAIVRPRFRAAFDLS